METTFLFRVRAKNIHGYSEPSAVSDPFILTPPTPSNEADASLIEEGEESCFELLVFYVVEINPRGRIVTDDQSPNRSRHFFIPPYPGVGTLANIEREKM